MGDSKTIYESPARKRLLLALLFAAAFFFRLAYAWENKVYINPEDFENGTIAQNIIAGRGFSGGAHLGPEAPTAFMAPFYPFFLAFFYKLFPETRFIVIILLQCALSALTCLLVYFIARRAFRDTGTSFFASLGIALSYFSIQIASWINVQAWTEFLLAVIVLLSLKVKEEMSLKGATFLGVSIALGALAEPVTIAASGPLLLWLLLGGGAAFAKRLEIFLIAGLIACLGVAPWTVRNYIVFKRFVPIKSQFGYVLWWGSNPNASGGLLTEKGVPVPDTLDKETRAGLARMDEISRFKTLEKKALDFALEHPGRFLKLRLRSYLYFWTGQNIWLKEKAAYEHPVTRPLMVLLFGLAGAGLILSIRKRRLPLPVLLPLLFYPLPYAITHADILYRYRVPIDPYLILFGAYALGSAAGWTIRRKRGLPGG